VTVNNANAGPDVHSESAVMGVLGGKRKTTTTRLSGPSSVMTSINSEEPGSALLNSGSSTKPRWDFEYLVGTVGNRDLTDSSTKDRFHISFLDSDLGATVSIKVTETAGAGGSTAEASVGSPAGASELYMLFSN